MGLSLHKMYEVLGLMIGDTAYEAYVPSTEELHLLKKRDPLVYETYLEVLCHFHICGQVTRWRSRRIKHMSWETYLFSGVNKATPMFRLAPSTNEEIFERISASTNSYTTESNEDTFKPDTVFESFHYQARILMSDRALLVGFLMLWLKRCVVPTLSHEVIVVNVVSPAVLLAYGKSIALLLAMMAGILSGLYVLAKSFYQVEAIVDAEGHPVTDSNGRPLVKTISPRVKLPYTYLMAWYIMHCPSLMTAVSASEDFTPYV